MENHTSCKLFGKNNVTKFKVILARSGLLSRTIWRDGLFNRHHNQHICCLGMGLWCTELSQSDWNFLI